MKKGLTFFLALAVMLSYLSVLSSDTRALADTGTGNLTDADAYFQVQDTQTLSDIDFSSGKVSDYLDQSTNMASEVPFYSEGSGTFQIVPDIIINGERVSVLQNEHSFASIVTRKAYNAPVIYEFNMGVNMSGLTHAGFSLRSGTAPKIYGGYDASGSNSGKTVQSCIDVDLYNSLLQNVAPDGHSCINLSFVDTTVATLHDAPHVPIELPAGVNLAYPNRFKVIDKGDSIAIEITPYGTTNTVPLCIIKLQNFSDSIYKQETIYEGDGSYYGIYTAQVSADSRIGFHARTSTITVANLKISGYTDKTELEDAINAAAYYDAADYEADAWSKMQDALQEATAVDDDEGALQTDVNRALKNLKAAFNGLVYVNAEQAFRLKAKNVSTPKSICKIDFSKASDIAQYVGDTKFFAPKNEHNGTEMLDNGAMKVGSSYAEVVTNATYDAPVSYTFQMAVDPATVSHAGVTLRAMSTAPKMYGGYDSKSNDRAQGIEFSIVNKSKESGHFCIVPNDSYQFMRLAPSYAVAYPEGFDPTAVNTYTIYDNGDTIGISVNGKNVAFIVFSNPSGDTYLSGSVFGADGVMIGQPFYKTINAKSNIGFNIRNANLWVHNFEIQTTKAVAPVNISVSLYQSVDVTEIPFATQPHLISTAVALDPSTKVDVGWKIVKGNATLQKETLFNYDPSCQSMVRVKFNMYGTVVVRCYLLSDPAVYFDYTFNVLSSKNDLLTDIKSGQPYMKNRKLYDQSTWLKLYNAMKTGIEVYNADNVPEATILNAIDKLSDALDGLALAPEESEEASALGAQTTGVTPTVADDQTQTGETEDSKSALTVDYVKFIIASSTTDTMDFQVVNGSAVLTKEMQKLIKNTGKTAKFEFYDDSGNVVFAWQFKNFGDCAYDIDLSYNISSPYESAILTALSGAKTKEIVSLCHHSELPDGTMLIVKNDAGFKKNDNITLRYLDTAGSKLQAVKSSVLLTSNLSFIGFSVSHASDYVLIKDDPGFKTVAVDTVVKNNVALIILIAVSAAVLVVGASATAFVLLRKRNRKRQAPEICR